MRGRRRDLLAAAGWEIAGAMPALRRADAATAVRVPATTAVIARAPGADPPSRGLNRLLTMAARWR